MNLSNRKFVWGLILLFVSTYAAYVVFLTIDFSLTLHNAKSIISFTFCSWVMGRGLKSINESLKF